MPLVSDGGRRDVVLVDQAHQVVERRHGPRVVEGEPVAVGEHPPCRADVVQIDALKIVGGVVSPLPDASGVEAGFVGPASVGVDGQSGKQGPQGVDIAGRPPRIQKLAQIDARRLDEVGVEVDRDACIRQLRHRPQRTVAGELVDHRRLPTRCSVRSQRFRDVHQPVAVGVSGEVRVRQPEDVIRASTRGVGAQGVEIGCVRHHVHPHVDVGMDPGELVERFPVRGGHLLVPQAHGHHRAACGFGRPAQ